jgi:hypothetical protein
MVGMALYRARSLAHQLACPYNEEIGRCAKLLAALGRVPSPEAVRGDIRRWWRWHGVMPSEYTTWRFDEKNSAARRTFYSRMDLLRFSEILNDPDVSAVLEDKYATYLQFRAHFGREVVFFGGGDGELAAATGFAERHPAFFAKPLSGYGGRGTRLFRAADLPPGGLAGALREMAPCILEEPIVQHPSTAAFHPASLNTVRVATLSAGTPEATEVWFAFLRTGRGGSVVDNTSSGGVFAPVNPATGTVCGDAHDWGGETYAAHPDTGTPFRGFAIPFWAEMAAAARELALELPGCRYVAWDFAATPRGAVLVEANGHGGLSMLQTGRATGLRGECERILRLWTFRGALP